MFVICFLLFLSLFSVHTYNDRFQYYYCAERQTVAAESAGETRIFALIFAANKNDPSPPPPYTILPLFVQTFGSEEFSTNPKSTRSAEGVSGKTARFAPGGHRGIAIHTYRVVHN